MVLARDEEMGLHDGDDGRVEHEEGEDDIDNELQPPPPAYGLWRSSVVCAPCPYYHCLTASLA